MFSPSTILCKCSSANSLLKALTSLSLFSRSQSLSSFRFIFCFSVICSSSFSLSISSWARRFSVAGSKPDINNLPPGTRTGRPERWFVDLCVRGCALNPLELCRGRCWSLLPDTGLKLLRGPVGGLLYIARGPRRDRLGIGPSRGLSLLKAGPPLGRVGADSKHRFAARLAPEAEPGAADGPVGGIAAVGLPNTCGELGETDITGWDPQLVSWAEACRDWSCWTELLSCCGW